MRGGHPGIRRLAATTAVVAIIAAACSSASPSAAPSAAPTDAASTAPSAARPSRSSRSTIDWWHIQNTDPGCPCGRRWPTSTWRRTRTSRSRSPSWRTRRSRPSSPPTTQAGDVARPVPVVGRRRARQQVDAGLVKDITADIAPWTGHDQPRRARAVRRTTARYGVPFDLGMVGFWYNKALFAKAGITAPPTTWAEFLDRRRQAQGRRASPRSPSAGKDKWPGMLLLGLPRAARRRAATRCSKAVDDRQLDDPAFVQAGDRAQEARRPRSRSRRASSPRRGTAPDGQAATMGNGKAAMELMGQWAPGTMNAQLPGPEGHRRRPRLVPVPGRRRRRGRRRPTRSAAATGSPSARTPRPRPSTS